jgi:cytidylate kinase
VTTPDGRAARLAAPVADRLLAVPPRAGHTRVLAIDGRSGSGKTTLAISVTTLLADRGQQVGLVHLDELYPGWDGLAASVPLLRDGVLAPLAAGRPAAFTRWDWRADRPGDLRLVPATNLLVIEGAGCGSRPSRPYLSLLVWLQAPAQVRYRRAIGRDGDLYAPHWQRWAAQEDRLFERERTAAAADLVLDTSG